MTAEDKKRAEIQELNLLVERGVSFNVDRVVKKKRPGILGRLGLTTTDKIVEVYVINEPTLAVLDRIALEQIEMTIDEKTILADGFMNEVRKLTFDHSIRFARILAIAVIGEDAFEVEQRGSHCRYKYNEKRIEELASIFAHGIKPSKLIKLVELVNTTSNLVDFINSIRLMSASRTTMPIRIEENKKG